MKLIVSIILFAQYISAFADIKANIYNEQTPNGYEIYADNEEYCCVSVLINFKLTNLNSTDGNNKVFVIPAKSKKYLLTNLVVKKKGVSYKFSLTTKINFGDHYQSTYNDSLLYYLPFKKGESYPVSQGNNGSFSHQNENAIDFTMPVGTEIYSARDGIVVKVMQSNNKRCEQKKCAEYNNYILVYHSDGTFAEYTHIKKNGSVVNEGDKITIGQLLGYSGNVGWSTDPHLHFIVFLQKMEDRKSIKTKFLIGDGKQSEILVQKKIYNREY